MATKHTITLDGHTATANELNKSVRLKIQLKKRDRQWIGLACKSQDIPVATVKRRVQIIVILEPGQRGADPDAFFKSLADALKQAGAIKNDSAKWVEWPPVQYERGKKPGMRIVLEDVGPAQAVKTKRKKK